MVISFFVICLSWYSYTAGALKDLVDIITYFYYNFLPDLFEFSVRTTQLNVTQSLSDNASTFSLWIFLIVNLIVVVGLINIIFKPKENRIEPKYMFLSALSGIIIILSLLLPNLAPVLNLSRFYGISLLISAPALILGFNFFVKIGANAWIRLAHKKFLGNRCAKIRVMLLCLILIIFFLTQTGFVNHITGSNPLVRPIDLDRLKASNSRQIETSFYASYFSEQDVSAAVWLSKNRDPGSAIYADYVSRHNVLTSYGLIIRDQIMLLNNVTVFKPDSYIYLSRHNVVLDVISYPGGYANLAETLSFIEKGSLLYTNGASEIWEF